jgi:ribonucleoside-diphosphate reductase alpha chain
MNSKMTIKHIIKRDGRIARFQKNKIADAISKAMRAVKKEDPKQAAALATKVALMLEKNFSGKTPTVEDVQDMVEKTLMADGNTDAAKAYILYRKRREDIRTTKAAYGVYDELKLSVNAVKVLERRYLQKDERGRVAETPAEMFDRVAKNVASAEKLYGRLTDAKKTEEAFYAAMTALSFLPNSPTLMNAGTAVGQMAACFVLPVEDSMESIFSAVKNAALIHQSGGGTGFSFSRLRPKDDIVKSTGGVASGPVSFMRVFNVATDVIRQGGRRRGANMGILRVDHPDIIEFITAKENENEFSNFNLSVSVTDEFMEAAKKDMDYSLVNPRTGKPVRKINARKVFDLIVAMAWKNGEPGIIFIDTINRSNPTPSLGKIEATNPCGEVPLLPYESCNLGSINLSNMVADGKIDWEKLGRTVDLGVRFLDNVIDVNKYPLSKIEDATKGNRKIGLGIMGFADALVLLGVPYDSKEGVSTAEKIMKFIKERSRKASEGLSISRGSFPNISKSTYRGKRMRNATTTSVAPTGSISIIANCSSGIEPLFALSYVRNVLGTELIELNSSFEKIARERGFYSEPLMRKVASGSSIQSMSEIPKDVRKIFVTAHEIAPKWHIMMQAAFQKHVDNSISKTINFPENATPEDVENAFILAHELGCKGITVYRNRSRSEQVLNMNCPTCSV